MYLYRIKYTFLIGDLFWKNRIPVADIQEDLRKKVSGGEVCKIISKPKTKRIIRI